MSKSRLQSIRKVSAQIALKAISFVAEKNATVLCRGYMYEPSVPEKFKKKN